MERNDLIRLFEDTMTRAADKGTIKPYNFGKMMINGGMEYYIDSETDNAFIGFVGGFRVAEKLYQKEG